MYCTQHNMKNKVIIIQEGYCDALENNAVKADCTISLIKSRKSGWLLVDTGGPWNKDKLIKDLQSHCTDIGNIRTVVCTHGHSDHVGNLNIFSYNTRLIVGNDISVENVYEDFDFKAGTPYKISDDIEILSTPGHTHSDVSVVVRNTDIGTVVIAGDLFEKAEDRYDEDLWRSNSENPTLQMTHREMVTSIADYIVPGHGPMFFNDRKLGKQ